MGTAMIKVLLFVSNVFDSIERYWEKLIVKKYMGPTMVLVYLLSLFIIELKRRSLLPDALGEIVPYSHFAAANVAFSLFLIISAFKLALLYIILVLVTSQLSLKSSFRLSMCSLFIAIPWSVVGRMTSLKRYDMRFSAPGPGVVLRFVRATR